MTPSRATIRPLAVVPPPALERKRRPKHEQEPERTALQVCLEHALAEDEVAERVLSRCQYAAFVNIRIRQLVIREQDLAA